jgi:hypothetical protein
MDDLIEMDIQKRVGRETEEVSTHGRETHDLYGRVYT